MSVRDRLRGLGKHRGVRYAASLPERAVRSASALAAGTVREIAAVALPIGFRRGRLYRSLVDVTLQFLIENVGGVENAQPSESKLSEDFLLRRAAGNGIELMGVIAFRASPVWVLAALADVAGFGRQLIPEIAEALRKEGLLAPANGPVTTMEQLLQGLERSSAQLAETVNTPPLDVAGLRREWAKFVAEARQLPAPQLPSASGPRPTGSSARSSKCRRYSQSLPSVSCPSERARCRRRPPSCCIAAAPRCRARCSTTIVSRCKSCAMPVSCATARLSSRHMRTRHSARSRRRAQR